MEKYSELTSEINGLLKIPIKDRSMAQNGRIVVLNTKLNELDKTIERVHRPIGNYKKDIKDVFTKD